MYTDTELTEYLDEIRTQVCSRCVERPPGGPPCAPLGKDCGIELHLPRLIESIREVHSVWIEPYLEHNREGICAKCAFLNSSICPCPMDYLSGLLVEAVETVDERKRSRQARADPFPIRFEPGEADSISNPTTMLRNEHRVIEQVLNCLEVLADRAHDGWFEREAAGQAIDFFRNFADRCHHAKEETHLFPAMEVKGLPRHGGPTGAMIAEHELGRRSLAVMQEAIDNGDGACFAQEAHRYVLLLRDHIFTEDHRLFPLAEALLAESERSKLLAAFADLENEETHRGTHEKYLRLADDLADRFGIPHATHAIGDSGCTACGCGHPS
jgi:hemerythrin-like domain-containing protein